MTTHAGGQRSVGKPRGEYSKTAARREQILASALDVFSTSGFHKGALRDVADRAGLSQAGVLHHFPNKIALLEGVLVWRDELSRRSLDSGADDPLGRLRAVIRLIEHNQTTPGLIKLYATLQAESTSPDHPAHDYFVRRTTWVVDTLAAALTDGIKAGVVRPDIDPVNAARSTVALMDGLQIQWLLDRASVDMPAIVRDYLQSLLLSEL